jgi:ABC-type transporter Mla subunit MlaD
MLHEVGNLVKALHEVAGAMTSTQVDFAEAGRNLNELTGTYANRLTRLSSDIEEIKSLLRHGFRLSPDE